MRKENLDSNELISYPMITEEKSTIRTEPELSECIIINYCKQNTPVKFDTGVFIYGKWIKRIA